MFNIFNKTQTTILEFFTFSQQIAESFPPVYTTRKFPAWFKSIPNKLIQRNFQKNIDIPYGTIKTCDGVREYFKNTIIFSLWTDLLVKTEETGRFASVMSDNLLKNLLNEDSLHEFGTLYMDNPDPTITTKTIVPDGNNIFKDTIACHFVTPWIVNTRDKNLRILVKEPFYHRYDSNYENMLLFPGVIQPYKMQVLNLIPYFPKVEKQYNFSLGQPIAQLIPLTEKFVEIKVTIITREEYLERYVDVGFRPSFNNNYRPKQDKIMDNEQASKCPFFNFLKK